MIELFDGVTQDEITNFFDTIKRNLLMVIETPASYLVSAVPEEDEAGRVSVQLSMDLTYTFFLQQELTQQNAMFISTVVSIARTFIEDPKRRAPDSLKDIGVSIHGNLDVFTTATYFKDRYHLSNLYK